MKNDQMLTHAAASYEHAKLFLSDSEGNQRARPSSERPLASVSRLIF
jgi:hypothetical protein